jgi:hypothetical protein
MDEPKALCVSDPFDASEIALDPTWAKVLLRLLVALATSAPAWL